MKKTLLTVVAVLATVASFAAAQYSYEFGKIGHIPNDYKNPNNGQNLTAWADRYNNLPGGVQNTMYFMQSANLFVSFVGDAPTSWGAYYVDGNQKGQELTFATLSNGISTAVDGSNNPISFEPGTAIGFWVTDENGAKVYNTPRLDGEHYHTMNGTYMLENGTIYANGFGNYGDVVHSTSYDVMASASTYIMNVQVGTVKVSGQPLPGVIAVLAIGGAAAAGLKRFRKRKEA